MGNLFVSDRSEFTTVQGLVINALSHGRPGKITKQESGRVSVQSQHRKSGQTSFNTIHVDKVSGIVEKAKKGSSINNNT